MRVLLLLLLSVLISCSDENPCNEDGDLLYNIDMRIIDIGPHNLYCRVIDGPDTMNIVVVDVSVNIKYNHKVGDTVHYDYIRKDRFSKAQIEYFKSIGHACADRKEVTNE